MNQEEQRETPRTNFAAYEKHKLQGVNTDIISELDGARWCNLLNEARAMEIELQEAERLREENHQLTKELEAHKAMMDKVLSYTPPRINDLMKMAKMRRPMPQA